MLWNLLEFKPFGTQGLLVKWRCFTNNPDAVRLRRDFDKRFD